MTAKNSAMAVGSRVQERGSDVHTEAKKEDGGDEDRNETLSPSKLALFLDTERQNDGQLRRDTVSPEAFQMMVASLEEEEKKESENLVEEVEETRQEEVETSNERGKSSENDVRDSPARSTRSKTSILNDSVEMSVQVTQIETSMRSEALVFASKVSNRTRTTLNPTEAASVVRALQNEAKSIRDHEDGKQLIGMDKVEEEKKKKTVTPTKKKKTKLRRRKSLSPLHVSARNNSPVVATKSRMSLPTGKEIKTKESLSLVRESISTRRMTIDPKDVYNMLEEDSTLSQQDTRRKSIDEDEECENINTHASASMASREKTDDVSVRKRKQESNLHDESAKKGRRRSNDDETMDAMDVSSSFQDETKQQVPSSDYNTSESPLRISKPLFSPPLTRVQTPLKGILSARKTRQTAGNVVQTTPTKTVNFGPSQGAEFNHGSPSTSMTPMLAKDASRLFPSEPLASSEDEPDDAETSLNSLILDEVDARNDDKAEKPSDVKPWQLKKSGFSLLESRNSLLSSRSSDQRRRRQSVRWFSPLDARTSESRRRRRQTISSSISSAHSMALPSSSTPLEQPTVDACNSMRRPYVDSSASSDAGEDMEITGEYSFMLGRESDVMPWGDDTGEFSLSQLVAEASVNEMRKAAPEAPCDDDLPGSLTDLANEVVGDNRESHASEACFLKLNSQETTLDPIEEQDETLSSFQSHSQMSLECDASEGEVTTDLKVQVNLQAKFDQVKTTSESHVERPVCLITMKELVASIAFDATKALSEKHDAFLEELTPSSDELTGNKDVKLACVSETCTDVIRHHEEDVSASCTAVTDELSSLLELQAPAVFSPDTMDATTRELIEELYATEAMVARSGWCQLQTQVEKQLTSSLSRQAELVANDVNMLIDNVAADRWQREQELNAIKELIDREERVALLLDAIEEQQGVQNEYVAAVKELETECAGLSLEVSVLQSRLKALEGRAAELEPVTATSASMMAHQVLVTEEMLAIQEGLSVWTVREATSSVLGLVARFDDVMFTVDVCVNVDMNASLVAGKASMEIATNESLKIKEANQVDQDVVLMLQQVLLDPHNLSRIAGASEMENEPREGWTLSKVQHLEQFLHRSFRLLTELRELSTCFALRYNQDERTLCVDLVTFSSSQDRPKAHLSVGFSLLPVLPYTDYQTTVQVHRGQLSCQDVVQEIEQVSKHEPKYFVRVCRRVYDTFVR